MSAQQRNAVVTLRSRSRKGLLKRIRLTYKTDQTTYSFVNAILEEARRNGNEGAVAEHLVGALLVWRYPDQVIPVRPHGCRSFEPLEPGDYFVGNTVFFVTLLPWNWHFDQCESAVNAGLAVYLLVPERMLESARMYATALIEASFVIRSVESFVSEIVEWKAGFSIAEVKLFLSQLLASYNQRICSVEPDKSLLIDIPAALHAVHTHRLDLRTP
jgi:hypothetical protein